MTRRDCRGQLLPIAVIALVLLVFASAAIAHITMASWRSTLRVDADAEAANILASAINVVDGLATGLDSTGASRTPQQACQTLHTTSANPTPDCTPPNPALGTPAGADHDVWTAWMSLPSRSGCDTNVLEGCWRAKFTSTDITVDLEGQAQQTLTGWTVELQAAARCDLLPTAVNAAEDWCEVVTDPTALSYEPLALPLYSSIVGTPVLTQPMIDAALTAQVVFGAAPPAANTTIELSGSYGGVFINNSGNLGLCRDARTSQECGEDPGQAITLEAVDIADDACSTDPAVVPAVLSWVGGTTHTEAELDSYPGGGVVIVTAAQDDPTTPGDERSIYLTDDIRAPATEPLLIVSGCHVIVGSCVHQVPDIDPVTGLQLTDPNTGALLYTDSAPQRCADPAPPNALPDTRQLADITLENVILVSAGGLWAADLEPSPNACPTTTNPGYQPRTLIITGAVISGHAGSTSYWEDCDANPLTPTQLGANGREKIVTGYDRDGCLPEDAPPNPSQPCNPSSNPTYDQWAEANIAWWPGRDAGIWRRR